MTAGRIYTLDQIEAERMARHHSLKTWPDFFEQLLSGKKTAELRNDDRHFRDGDVLCLQEYDPETKQYTGRETVRIVSHVLRHDPSAGCAATFGLAPGYVILSLAETPRHRLICVEGQCEMGGFIARIRQLEEALGKRGAHSK